MSDERVTGDIPVVFSPKQRAQVVAKALSEAARRARFSTKHRRGASAGGIRARRGAKVFRLVKILSFIAIVAVPLAVVSVYYGFIAADQYVSEARFTVRGGTPPKLDGIGALTGAPSMLIIQDTQIIINYLQSRPLIEALDKTINLRDLYTDGSIDYVSRLDAKAKIEKVERYWKSMINLSVQMPAGIVVFTVRAFKPEDAARITDAALEASEVLVNKMNEQMINDTVSLSETERQRAEANLAKARAELETARNDEGVLSASRSGESIDGLINSVQAQLVKMQQDYETQRRLVNENSPTIRNLQIKITAANEEITKLQATLTGTGNKTISGAMSRLDYLTFRNQIAEKMYATSLAMVENAHIASETKLMYINTFVRPVLAQEAKYPHRLSVIGIFALAALATWGVVVAAAALIRKKMA